jgi:hypothetical protein
VYFGRDSPTFRRKIVPPFLGFRTGQQEAGGKCASCFLLGLLLNAEDGGNMFLRYVSELPRYISCELKFITGSVCSRD